MKGQIIKDWNNVGGNPFDYRNKKHMAMLLRNLQFFFALPDLGRVPEKFNPKNRDLDAAGKTVATQFMEKRKGYDKAAVQIQQWANLNDFPTTAKDVIEKYHEIPSYDDGWEKIFDVRDMTSSRRDGFSMSTVQSGLTFKKMKVGEKLEVFGMSGDREFVYYDYYGAALAWHRSLFENQDWWTIEDNALEFRNEAFRIRAATFYALIEAAADAKAEIAWQDSPDTLAAGTRGYLASRDAATINYACQTILLALENSGYGVNPQNIRFKMLAPIQLRGRMRLALANNYDIQATATPQLDYNVDLITTTMLDNTDHYKIILPGVKLKAGLRMDLTQFTEFDILSYVDTVAGWMAFGGAVGDSDQIEECNIV